VLAGTALFAAAAGAQTCPVPRDLWQSPRSGAVILSQPSIRQCVQNWLAKPGALLLIHHGMGDEAQLRAAELRYWLIALALDGKRIKLAGDLPAGQALNMEIKEGK
jgi:hypothetical protein